MNEVSSEKLIGLLKKVEKKDKQAFSELYRCTSSTLFSVLMVLLKHQAQAEEALQDAYINIWNKADQYQPHLGQPIGWMISIARYRGLDLLRKSNTRRNYEQDFSESEDTLNQEHIEAETEHLHECMQKLSDSQKECIMLTYREGYTHQELSEKMAKPIGTIKSWIRRSLERLKGCIHELSAS